VSSHKLRLDALVLTPYMSRHPFRNGVRTSGLQTTISPRQP